MKKKSIILIALSLVSLTIIAQQTILIKNISIVDVKKGSLIKNTNVFIENEKIKQINSNVNAIKTTLQTQIIDGTNKFLMPGYIDYYALMPSRSYPINYDVYFLLNLINGITS